MTDVFYIQTFVREKDLLYSLLYSKMIVDQQYGHNTHTHTQKLLSHHLCMDYILGSDI